MRLNKSYHPINSHLISLAGEGFSMLETTSQNEIVEFIQSQQHASGGFVDRGGKPDLYYSLFGAWHLQALGLHGAAIKLKHFIEGVEAQQPSVVDQFALILIKTQLQGDEYRHPKFWQLFNILLKKGKRLNLAYAVFLFLLAVDALYPPKRVLYFLAKLFVRAYKLPESSPCSMRAAILAARFQVGLPVETETKELFLYFEEGKGFRAYKNIETADLLSTAVALFALKRAGQDLRVVAPDCLGFIQQNFDSGAFLPGDDSTDRDLEYTFYGLLALGALV